jgi:hypothetical protein
MENFPFIKIRETKKIIALPSASIVIGRVTYASKRSN